VDTKWNVSQNGPGNTGLYGWFYSYFSGYGWNRKELEMVSISRVLCWAILAGTIYFIIRRLVKWFIN